ncbi:ATP-binding cassette domain-containing protein [Paenibacillus sp. H1-7]|uniref:ATP-binding cassette domain-containing protein n=1 Tax=Paenibacillus sp. H1-7 TaxID=2282849 RepID=UPI0031F2E973
MASTILEIQNLRKVYSDGTAALQGIDFQVQRGEFIAVIGPSGAGKSTLLRCINRLVEPSEGTVRFNGIDTTKANGRQIRKLRREVGMVFQGFNLIQRVTVLRNVLNGRLGYMNSMSGALGLYRKQDVEEAKHILHRVGLHEQMYKRAAGRHRPGAVPAAAAHLGRRADRELGPGHVRDDNGAFAQHLPRRRDHLPGQSASGRGCEKICDANYRHS